MRVPRLHSPTLRLRRRSAALVALSIAALGLALPAAGMAAPVVTEYNLPTSDVGPWGIAAGSDGNVWFGEGKKKAVGRATTSGTVTEFTTGINFGNVDGITAGPSNDLWFAESGGSGAIGRITTSGAVTEYTSGLTANRKPYGITLGPDGNLWFTENANPGAIGRITPTGTITEFTSGLTASSQPAGITAGPDGNLWFTETGNPGAIGRITPTGTITEFRTGLTTNSQPTGITAGPDGNLWFTENANPGAIGRITPTGTITEFTTGLTANSQPTGIAAGGDGNLWFTEATGKLGSITPAGTITEYATSNTAPWRIAAGPDGNMWFTENAAPGHVAQITIAPAVATQNPASFGYQAATLQGSVRPNAQATAYQFDWGTTSAYGNSTTATSAGSGATAQTVTAAIAGLSPSTVYHYRVEATNSSGTTYGADQTLTTLPPPPVATTAAATGTGQTSTTLNGTVNPNSGATTYHFDWGLTTAYGNTLPTTDAAVGSDSSVHSVSQALAGLVPATTYHFRVVATSPSGTTYGADQTVTTSTAPPSSATAPATQVGQTGAALNATVNPDGLATTYHFDWGLSASYGNQMPFSDGSVGADAMPHALSQALTGLASATTYHYRIVATNSSGTTYGPDFTFTTVPFAPALSGAAVTGVSTSTATLTANVNPNGGSTSYHFEFGTTPAYGRQAPAVDAGSDGSPHFERETLTGLDAATAYHFRVVATNAGGTSYGADVEFTTSAPAAPVPQLGRTVALAAVSGSVRISLPGARGFISLTNASAVPVGSTIDASRGTVALTSVRDAGGALQTGTFSGTRFRVTQSRSAHPLTVLTLTGLLVCGRHSPRQLFAARASRRRSLWGHDRGGRFVTRGRGVSANVRGTDWLTQDSCTGSLVKVVHGKVAVRDLRRHRTIVVAAGHSYFARTH